MAPKQVVTIRMGPKLIALVTAAATADRRTVSNWIELAIEQHIAHRAERSRHRPRKTQETKDHG